MSRTTALLQTPPVPDAAPVDPALGVGTTALGAFLSTLLVGAVMVALLPDYTRARMDQARRELLGSFLYGVLALVVLVVVVVALALTVVGLVVVPLALLAALVWAAGAVVAYLAVADRLVGTDDGWLKPLLVAALINGLLTLTAVGGLVSFVAGTTRFGAILRSWLE